jgi:hypothetical protein
VGGVGDPPGLDLPGHFGHMGESGTDMLGS